MEDKGWLQSAYLPHAAEEGEEDFIASEDDEQILSQSRKRLHDSSARQNRSVKDKLNWSDSSSQGSQIKKSIRQEPALPKEVAQPAGEEENVHRDTAIAGLSTCYGPAVQSACTVMHLPHLALRLVGSIACIEYNAMQWSRPCHNTCTYCTASL